MGGEGSILAMIISYRNNRELLKNRHHPFVNDRLNDLHYKSNRALKFRRVSAIKLEKIKEQIRQEARKERRKRLIVLISIILIALLTFWILLNPYL
jgi:hypothetical protein